MTTDWLDSASETMSVRLPFAASASTGGGRLLSAHEVTALGAPALFTDFGERLLFLRGQILDLRATVREADGVLRAARLPGSILREAVGLEYGWRHLAGCGCRLCAAVASDREQAGHAANAA